MIGDIQTETTDIDCTESNNWKVPSITIFSNQMYTQAQKGFLLLWNKFFIEEEKKSS
jgi:hypothetical protein